MKFTSNAKYGELPENGTIFTSETGFLHVVVHRFIYCEGWFLSCKVLGIDSMSLKSDTIIGAIEESKDIVKKVVKRLNNEVEDFCEEEIEISRY